MFCFELEFEAEIMLCLVTVARSLAGDVIHVIIPLLTQYVLLNVS